MKKVLLGVLFLLGFGVAWLFSNETVANVDELISPNEIYVFIQKGCPHCLAAEKYLDEKHPDLNIRKVDIAEKQNRNLFYACGAKFKLSKYTLGTPLFCMGDKYILGWDYEAQEQFEEYLKDFSSAEKVSDADSADSE